MDHNLKKLAMAAGLALGVFTVVSVAGVTDAAQNPCVSVPSPSSCAATRVEAAGKKAEDKLECYAEAVSEGKPVDQQCLDHAEKRFQDRFDLKDTGDCLSMVDEETIERKIDCMVLDVVCELTGGSDCDLVCNVP